MSKDENLKKEVEAAKERKSRWNNKEAEEEEAPREQGGDAKRTKQENPATPSVAQEETVGEHQAGSSVCSGIFVVVFQRTCSHTRSRNTSGNYIYFNLERQKEIVGSRRR